MCFENIINRVLESALSNVAVNIKPNTIKYRFTRTSWGTYSFQHTDFMNYKHWNTNPRTQLQGIPGEKYVPKSLINDILIVIQTTNHFLPSNQRRQGWPWWCKCCSLFVETRLITCDTGTEARRSQGLWSLLVLISLGVRVRNTKISLLSFTYS